MPYCSRVTRDLQKENVIQTSCGHTGLVLHCGIALDKGVNKMIIFFIFLQYNISCGYLLDCLSKAIPMSTHKVCFDAKIILNDHCQNYPK